MMKSFAHFQKMLEEHKAVLEGELASVAQQNPDTPGDWEVKPSEIDIMDADLNEAADRVEAQQENQGILDDLEVQYQNVLRALRKIADGTYGTCEICGEAVEHDRLEANPSARTCKKHREEESALSK